MEKFVVSSSLQDHSSMPRLPKRQWTRSIAELEGRIGSDYRHQASQLLLQSYCEIYGVADLDGPLTTAGEGISALEFDTKGIYLASVTKSGCLTVHDFETLYCNNNAGKPLVHKNILMSLDSIRWNPSNQDEVLCASRQSEKVIVYDISYVSPVLVDELERGKSKFSGLNYESSKGLSDIILSPHDKSRLLGSGLDGSVYMWDRRASKIPCLEFISNSHSPLNSIQLDKENRVVFGANKNGIIYAWDLRGGKSLAFLSPNKVPVLTLMKVSSMLEKISSLKEQSNIVSKEIHSINFNPFCPYQLAFHLDDGWSGVINVNELSVTHVHCPPPDWLEGMDISTRSNIRRTAWLHTCPIYAVGSSSNSGIYLLDFNPNKSSACHVDFNDEMDGESNERNRRVKNGFVPLSQDVISCAAHPLNNTLIAGTKQSSLIVVSQKHSSSKESN